jgi:hypothetical protein
MNHPSEIPFESIEGSMEYVSLLAEVIEEASRDIADEIALAEAEGAHRRKEALQLVAFKLAKLSANINCSRRIINDLRTLRRLLLEERKTARAAGAVTHSP